jgi:hypothetical protein
MVYRLVPTYRFAPRSHFGAEDVVKKPFLTGFAIGLLIAIAVWVGLAFYLVAPTTTMMQELVDVDDKKVKTVVKNRNFWMAAAGSAVGLALIGGVISHNHMAAGEVVPIAMPSQ